MRMRITPTLISGGKKEVPKNIETDKQALDEAAALQAKSKEAAKRMQQKLHETEEMGAMTLEDLYERRRQLESIEQEGNRLDETLEETQELHKKLGGLFSVFQRALPNVGGKGAASLPDEPNTIFKKGKDTTSANAEGSKKRWKLRVTKKKNKDKNQKLQSSIMPDDPALIPSEHADQMRTLEKGDNELDDELDEIGMQLDNMMRMAQEIGAESHDQGKQIRKVRHQLAGTEIRQQAVNEKARRMLQEGPADKGDSGGKMFSFTPW
ncbi:expressed unknown protein [Seminavis robusta]|uniref:t-SNARE coiled-coil homology domain-containing protein n=1 Tax=Seminavis robusta TaxID=568900 RepID=A0A9N8DBU4_9STRA|nr:expressed unknown protein [Seminavis robusta]|eukprot:Sro10_g008110.1 n/a (266) ;mRNA; f:121849-122646